MGNSRKVDKGAAAVCVKCLEGKLQVIATYGAEVVTLQCQVDEK